MKRRERSQKQPNVLLVDVLAFALASISDLPSAVHRRADCVPVIVPIPPIALVMEKIAYHINDDVLASLYASLVENSTFRSITASDKKRTGTADDKGNAVIINNELQIRRVVALPACIRRLAIWNDDAAGKKQQMVCVIGKDDIVVLDLIEAKIMRKLESCHNKKHISRFVTSLCHLSRFVTSSFLFLVLTVCVFLKAIRTKTL